MKNLALVVTDDSGSLVIDANEWTKEARRLIKDCVLEIGGCLEAGEDPELILNVLKALRQAQRQMQKEDLSDG